MPQLNEAISRLFFAYEEMGEMVNCTSYSLAATTTYKIRDANPHNVCRDTDWNCIYRLALRSQKYDKFRAAL